MIGLEHFRRIFRKNLSIVLSLALLPVICIDSLPLDILARANPQTPFQFQTFAGTSDLFPLYSSNDFSRMFTGPELQVPDTLPSPRRQLPICNRYRNA
jgi:hypothetical protein